MVLVCTFAASVRKSSQTGFLFCEEIVFGSIYIYTYRLLLLHLLYHSSILLLYLYYRLLYLYINIFISHIIIFILYVRGYDSGYGFNKTFKFN